MSRYKVCRDCGGRGRVRCWACHGTEEHPSKGHEADHCPECVDGMDVCDTCEGQGGWYNE